MGKVGRPPTSGTWKKGMAPLNPKGRPPILLPALQKEIDSNRNALKQLILKYISMTEEECSRKLAEPTLTNVEMMLIRCIQETGLQGDVDRFRKLLEIVFGKLPEDKAVFDVSEEEKELVQEYRRRLEAQKSLENEKPES